MFDWALSVVTKLGYVGVAFLTLLENVFPPIPSELVIPLGGYIAADGELTLWGVITAGTVGSVAGAVLWYELGRRVGERRVFEWVSRHGKWITLSRHDIERANGWFDRHGKTAVLIGRLVPGVRTFVSLPAGFTRMPRASFLVYTTIGTVAWTAALGYAGYVLRANFGIVGDYLNTVTNVLLAGLVVVMIWRYVRCWRSSRESVPAGSGA